MGDVARKSGLKQLFQTREDTSSETKVGLLSSFGIMVSTTISLLQAIRSGKAFSYIPLSNRLVPQEAAEILNVSEPYLNTLLDEKKIPHVRTGMQRRVRYKDLMAYKERRDQERSQLVSQIVAVGQKYETQ